MTQRNATFCACFLAWHPRRLVALCSCQSRSEASLSPFGGQRGALWLNDIFMCNAFIHFCAIRSVVYSRFLRAGSKSETGRKLYGTVLKSRTTISLMMDDQIRRSTMQGVQRSIETPMSPCLSKRSSRIYLYGDEFCCCAPTSLFPELDSGCDEKSIVSFFSQSVHCIEDILPPERSSRLCSASHIRKIRQYPSKWAGYLLPDTQKACGPVPQSRTFGAPRQPTNRTREQENPAR